MNRVAPSLPPSEDLDDLLGAFFKGEMPSPWPECKLPASTRILPLRRRASPPKSRPLLRSRLALVASVGLLLFTAWLLAGKHSTTSSPSLPTLTEPGSSSLKNLRPVGPVTRPGSGQLTPVSPKDNPVPAETIEVDKEGRAKYKLTFPGIVPNK